MLSVGFMVTQRITGKVSSIKENGCEPDYLLEKVWYEDVDDGFAETRCKTLCWRDFHVDTVKIERKEDKVNNLDFVRVICYCDQNDCG